MSSKLLAMAATLALAASVAQAAEPVAIPGSAWMTAGTLKAKVESFKEEFVAAVSLEFGPTVDLSANQFRLTVDDGVDPVEVVGTYVESKPGKPSLDDLGDDVLAAALGLVPGLQGLELSSKIKAKPKLKDGVETIKVTFKIKAKVPIPIEPFGESMRIAIGYKGEGGRIVTP
jgi:hypothetical protein